MKKLMVVLILVFCAGCGEEFAAGMATGVAAMKKMSDDAQNKFIVAVNELNTETERLNSEIGAVKDIDIDSFIKPETRNAISSLEANKDNPMSWVALASMLAGGFFGGQSYVNRKKTN